MSAVSFFTSDWTSWARISDLKTSMKGRRCDKRKRWNRRNKVKYKYSRDGSGGHAYLILVVSKI